MRQFKENEIVYEDSPASMSAEGLSTEEDAGLVDDAPAPPPPVGGLAYLSSSADQYDEGNLYYSSAPSGTSGVNSADVYAQQHDVHRDVASLRIPQPPSGFLESLQPGSKAGSKVGSLLQVSPTRFTALSPRPPQCPCSEKYPFADTTFYITQTDAVATANAIVEFLELEVGDVVVKTHKWVIKGEFFLNGIPFEMKCKMFTVADDKVAVEFMRRSGCALSFHRTFSDCVRCIRETSPHVYITCAAVCSTDEHFNNRCPENVLEGNTEVLQNMLSRVEETVTQTRGYKGECLTALWRLVQSQKFPAASLLDTRMVNTIMSSMQSQDQRESYVAAVLFTAVVQNVKQREQDGVSRMLRCGILEGVLDAFSKDDVSNTFHRELSSGFALVCQSCNNATDADLRHLLNRVNSINSCDSTVQGNLDMSRQALTRHLDVFVR